MTRAGGDETVVDARGLACPAPVIRIAAAARSLPPGSLVTVLWTDPAARHDVPAWARMRGHTVVATDVAEGSTTVRTHDGPGPSGPGPS